MSVTRHVQILTYIPQGNLVIVANRKQKVSNILEINS